MPDTAERPAGMSLLEWLDARQNRVLEQLDSLAARAEMLAARWRTETQVNDGDGCPDAPIY